MDIQVNLSENDCEPTVDCCPVPCDDTTAAAAHIINLEACEPEEGASSSPTTDEDACDLEGVGECRECCKFCGAMIGPGASATDCTCNCEPHCSGPAAIIVELESCEEEDGDDVDPPRKSECDDRIFKECVVECPHCCMDECECDKATASPAIVVELDPCPVEEPVTQKPQEDYVCTIECPNCCSHNCTCPETTASPAIVVDLDPCPVEPVEPTLEDCVVDATCPNCCMLKCKCVETSAKPAQTLEVVYYPSLYLFKKCSNKRCTACQNRSQPNYYCPQPNDCCDQINACEAFQIQICNNLCPQTNDTVELKLRKNRCAQIITLDPELMDGPDGTPSQPACPTFFFPDGLDAGWWQAQLVITRNGTGHRRVTGVDKFHIEACLIEDEDLLEPLEGCVPSDDSTCNDICAPA